MKRLTNDLRFGCRLLVKRPLFTLAIVLTLALGIGVTTAISSAVDAVLVKPWPYEDPTELIALRGSFEHQRATWVSFLEYRAWQERARTFEGIAAHRQTRNRLDIDGRPVGVIGVQASAELFALLGVEPLIGRVFTTDEDVPGAPGVVVLSHPFWQRQFGGRESILGETLTIEGLPFEVIGVMKPGMLYPGDFRATALWTPIGQIVDETWGWNYETHAGIQVTGRLADGVSLEAARIDMNRLAAELEAEHPDTHQGRGVFMQPVLERSFGELRPRVLALTGAAILVLLIACVNVANLLLVRGADRTGELAVRRALGASKPTVVRQLLAESLLLAWIGGIAGLVVAWLTLQGLVWVADVDSMPAFRDLTIDGRILAFSAAAAIATGLVFGIVPAFAGAGTSGAETLHGTRNSANPQRGRLRDVLVIAEIALALVLSICAVLSVRSFLGIVDERPGYDPDNLLTFAFSLPDEGYSPEEQAVFFDGMLERLESLPGVDRATTTVPITAYWSVSFDIVGRPQEETRLSAASFTVSPGFFETLDVRLLRGRVFDSTDRAEAVPVVVVDQLFAQTFWPDGEALGQRLRLAGDAPDGPGREVVGIVERSSFEGPHLEITPTLYQPVPQAQNGWGWAVMRTTVPPEELVDTVDRAMAEVSSDVMLSELWTMQDRLAKRRSAERLAAALLSSFAVLALLLAAIGVYSVLAYTVAARGRELAIRSALGAGRSEVMGLVLRRGLNLIAAGVGLGLILSVASARLLASQLYGIGPYDLVTWSSLVAIVAIGSLAACALPAWRAGRAQPASVLRGE